MTAQLLFRAVRASPLVLVAVIAISPAAPPGELDWVRVADNSSGFVAGPPPSPSPREASITITMRKAAASRMTGRWSRLTSRRAIGDAILLDWLERFEKRSRGGM